MSTEAPEATIQTLKELPEEVLEFLLEVLKRRERQNANESIKSNSDD